MPTNEEVDVLPSPPAEVSSSRASFASCPPEEDRDHHAPREERIDSSGSEDEDEGEVEVESEEVHDEHMAGQQPTPEPEEQSRSMDAPTGSHGTTEHIEDAGIESEEHGSVNSPIVPIEQGAAVAHGIPHDGADSEDEPLYLAFPESKPRRHIPTTTSFLQPGSKFKGTQQSDRQVYSVDVEIKSVDISASMLTGYLRIQGLADDHPTLTTFFEGEIIGSKYLFKTAHPSWGSNEKVDLQHWARFPAWRPLAKQAKNPGFTLRGGDKGSSEHLFMRWKEYFLVPDHRVKTITGASFEGFYYICFNQCTGTVSGIYYHAKSEKYQQLELEHVEDRGCVGAMEFR